MQPNQIVRYVADKAKSGNFYEGILGQAFVDLSPNFGVFSLDGGWTLALLQTDGGAGTSPESGSSELVFSLDSKDQVDAAAREWKGRGVTLVSEPAEVPFGYTFVAQDPDGFLLRVGYFPQG